MKLSMDFGRWTKTKATLAVAGALAIGGAVGSSVAMSPTVAPPIKWAGGWEVTEQFSAGVATLATVPPGSNLLITDLILSNFSDIRGYMFVSTAVGPASDSCNLHIVKYRLNHIAVPPGILHIPFQTGIGFGAGHRVCIYLSHPAMISARGFLFTPSPAS